MMILPGVCLLALVAPANAGLLPDKNFPLIESMDITSGRVIRTRTYEGKGLYGYIDGGAELYLEYGFRKLVVQEIVLTNHRMTVEIYQMESPLSAFGIFSISRYKCTSVDTLCEWSCSDRHQLQFAIGDFYFRVINGTSSEEGQSTSLKIAGVLKSKVAREKVGIPTLFAQSLLRPYRQGLKYMAGKLGLQNGLPDWSERFDGFEGFKLFVLPVATKDGEMSFGVIRFPDSVEAERFRKLVRDKATCYVRGIGSSRLVFTESALPPEVLTPYLDALSGAQRH